MTWCHGIKKITATFIIIIVQQTAHFFYEKAMELYKKQIHHFMTPRDRYLSAYDGDFEKMGITDFW